MRELKGPLISYVSEKAVESGLIGLRKIKADKNAVPCALIQSGSTVDFYYVVEYYYIVNFFYLDRKILQCS